MAISGNGLPRPFTAPSQRHRNWTPAFAGEQAGFEVCPWPSSLRLNGGRGAIPFPFALRAVEAQGDDRPYFFFAACSAFHARNCSIATERFSTFAQGSTTTCASAGTVSVPVPSVISSVSTLSPT